MKFTQLTKHGEVKRMSTWSLYSYVLVFWVQEGTLKTTKRETGSPTYKIFALQFVMPAKHPNEMLVQTCGSIPSMSDLT